MYRRVVVPLDGSPVAEAIFPFIETIGALDVEIVLVRVVTLSPEEAVVLGAGYWQGRSADPDHDAQEYLKSQVGALEAKGIHASAHVRTGNAADEIVDVAKAIDADLIAMTTHGRTGLGRLLFGSVAESVLRASPIPVFLLKVVEQEPID